MTGVDEGAFVGRQEIIAEVLRWVPDEQGRVPARGEIGPGSPATRQHAHGTWGIGKTTLLDELERQLRATSEALILRVDAGEWVPTAEPGPESGLPLRSLHANFLQFVGMLEHVCLSSKDLHREALLVREARAHVNMQRDAPKVETAVHAGGNISAQGESSIISVYLDEQRDEELCTKILEIVSPNGTNVMLQSMRASVRGHRSPMMRAGVTTMIITVPEARTIQRPRPAQTCARTMTTPATTEPRAVAIEAPPKAVLTFSALVEVTV